MAGIIIPIYIPYTMTDLQQQALYVWLETIASSVEKRRPFARRNQRHYDRVQDHRELLLLRLQLWQEEITDSLLKAEIAALTETIRENLHLYWQIAVSGGQQFDAYPITNSLCYFGVDVQAFEPAQWEEEEATPQELAALIKVMGALPKHRIELIAFEDGDEDHLLAAYMAAELSDQYQAFTRLLVKPNFFTRRGELAWTLDDSRALIQSIEGIAHEIDDGYTTYHLVDGEFLRNWAQHPKFYLQT